MYKTECVVSIECNCGFKYVFLKWFNFHILIAVMNVAHTFCVRLVFRFQYCFKENFKKMIFTTHTSLAVRKGTTCKRMFLTVCVHLFF